MQASLPKELVPLGASFLLMVISTSCAIFLAIGQALFQDRLAVNLSKVASPQIVADILAVGPTRFRDVLQSANPQSTVQAYSDSITQVFVSLRQNSTVSQTLTLNSSYRGWHLRYHFSS